MRMSRALVVMIASVSALTGGAWRVGAAEKKKKKEPLKIVPVSEEEKAKLLAAESAEQKALRKVLKDAGKIAFASNMDGTQRIYIMNADGTDVKCLTPAPGPGGDYPHISPDGKKLIFNRVAPKKIINKMPRDPKIRKNYVHQCIYMMDVNGGKAEPVAAGSGAHWSWDGKKIIYAFDTIGRRGYGKTAILDLETKTERVITPKNMLHPIHFPCFAPDGKFAFVSNGPGLLIPLNEAGNARDEKGKVARIVGGHPCNMEVSPDGKWLTWVVDTSGDYGSWLKYAKARYDGRGVRGLSFKLGWKPGTVNYFPDFSPDGKYLVYVHADPQKGVKSWMLKTKQEIYVTTFPDCKTTVRVTWNGAGNQHPDWRMVKQ